MKRLFFFVFSLFVFSHLLRAEPPSAAELQSEVAELKNFTASLASMVETLNRTVVDQKRFIEEQNKRLSYLEGGTLQPKVIAASEPVPAAETEHRHQHNPDISMVGTVQAYLTENTDDEEGKDSIALKELELNFSQPVDAYSRLDAIISLNDAIEDHTVHIEEAYYTHWGLPFGLTGQIGKFRSQVGKQNVMHLHELDTVDYPLVIQDFFGEHGLHASGVRLHNRVPNPWNIPLEVTGEVLRGNAGASFSGISRRPIFASNVKTFFEPSENTALELGGSALFGDENVHQLAKGEDRYGVKVFGGDVTFYWHLPEARTLKFQNEVFFQDRSSLVTPNDDPWGLYSLLDLRVSPHWSTGIRFDYLEPRAVVDEHGRTVAVSPYITFWQSEFASFRFQYTHTEPADAGSKTDDAFYLQANIMIGTHEHSAASHLTH